MPGRIRLRAGAGARALPTPDRDLVDRFVAAVDGIEDVRLNPRAASLVVHYAPSRIRPSWWKTLIEGDDAACRALLERLADERLDVEALRSAAPQAGTVVSGLEEES